MVTGFFSGKELDLNVPEPVGGEYIGKLGGEGFVKVLKPVQEALNKVFLRGLWFCCFGEEYIDIFVRKASKVRRGITIIDEFMELDWEVNLHRFGVSFSLQDFTEIVVWEVKD